MQKPSIPKGTRDFSPEEMAKRNYIFNTIREVYHLYGFQQIETPAMENLSTLMGKYGEEGDKLLFKILNSGDCFSGITDEELSERNAVRFGMKACEKGLRYDLTVPFARYVVQHRNDIAFPFKRYQIQPVWRADRPQKGRFRQFVQCDIDILGDATNLAEIEEILALTKALKRICPDKAYTVRVNDRAILKGMADYSGFPENETDKVFIILDKMDKIGLDGVREELLAEGYAPEAVEKYTGLLAEIQNDAAGVRALGEKLSGVMDPAKAENLATIMETVKAVADIEFGLEFDPTLVRGMGYYTGTIFEVSMEGFGGSVAGGGRYDKLIGKFTGVDTPACGFSIGFERIITILMDSGFKVPEAAGKKAFLYEKGLSGEQFRAVLKKAQEERANGTRVAVAQMNKNKKFQKEQLAKDGYEEIVEFYKDSLK